MVSYRRGDIGRLTGETRTGANPFTASYTVDGAGNRTSQTIGGATTTPSRRDLLLVTGLVSVCPDVGNIARDGPSLLR